MTTTPFTRQVALLLYVIALALQIGALPSALVGIVLGTALPWQIAALLAYSGLLLRQEALGLFGSSDA